ncbi:MAG: hypothetical protein HYZ42_12395, partial [Bacteroidetes bacterium]|nr:hypothetical protein [Bacteroidota bacterium]
MEQYRKSDQYYIDEYDRRTIEILRQLDDQPRNFDPPRMYNLSNPEEFRELVDRTTAQLEYNNTGAIRAKNRDEHIRLRIAEDEYKDRMLRMNPVPENVRCNICGERMNFYTDLFKGTHDKELVYLFDCPNNHDRKCKAVYPNGKEWIIPERSCIYCGGRIITTTKNTKKTITLTDTCEKCDKKEVLELDRSIEKILLINEAERKKYCLDFKGRKTFREDLEALASLADSRKEKETKYDYSHIQQLNISKLERLLTEYVENAGFVKLQFDKPKNDRYLTVEFSAQDPTDRDSRISIKALKKVIEQTLFSTNWKLMAK